MRERELCVVTRWSLAREESGARKGGVSEARVNFRVKGLSTIFGGRFYSVPASKNKFLETVALR